MYVNLCALNVVNTLITFYSTHQKVSANRTEQLSVKLQSILDYKYQENGGLRALDYRVEKFSQYIGS